MPFKNAADWERERSSIIAYCRHHRCITDFKIFRICVRWTICAISDRERDMITCTILPFEYDDNYWQQRMRERARGTEDGKKFQLIREVKLYLESAVRKQSEIVMKSHHNLSLHVRDAQLLMLIFKLYSVLTYSVHASKSSLTLPSLSTAHLNMHFAWCVFRSSKHSRLLIPRSHMVKIKMQYHRLRLLPECTHTWSLREHN